MLKIKDSTGKTIGVLKDEDDEPEITLTEKAIRKKIKELKKEAKEKEALDKLTQLSQELNEYQKPKKDTE